MRVGVFQKSRDRRVGWIVFLVLGGGFIDRPGAVDFAEEVLPLFSDRCFACHGPDAGARKASLRLDDPSVVSPAGSESGIIVPAAEGLSELIRRVSDSGEDRMPPSGHGPPLTVDEVDLLRRWIREGARWEQHWAFQPVQRPEVPRVRQGERLRNPIDAFVASKLEVRGLAPSPEAPSGVLRRRVALGLLGLPEDQVDPDESYEDYVNRLLSSPAYGERMSQLWLDLARYADTSGYQNDGPRTMWRWRDWVIDAWNRNQPFDEFSRDQLAGDLLPGPTLAQRIATGFNRNHRGNAEGGIVPEEYAVEYVVDRVETFGTVWLGLSLGCARCHDHKYDPISQKEFYQLYSFFNSIPEHGRAIKEGNSPPFIRTPTRFQAERLAALATEETQARRAFEQEEPLLVRARRQWERGIEAIGELPVLPGLMSRLSFDDGGDAVPVDSWLEEAGGSVRRVEGPFGSGVRLDDTSSLRSDDAGAFGYFDRFTISVWARFEAGEGTLWSRQVLSDRGSGYSLDLREGRLAVNLIRRWLDDAIRVESEQSFEPDRWYHVAVTYDGSRVARGIGLYVDGRRVPLKVHLDALNQSFMVTEPFRLGRGNGVFHGAMDEFRIYGRELDPNEIALLAVARTTGALAAVRESDRTEAEAGLLRNHFLQSPSGRRYGARWERWWRAREAYRMALDAVPTTMIMQELPQPRVARVLHRGRYDQPREAVGRQVPARFPPLPSEAPPNRLGLASWVTRPDHPLTARVMANRIWQLHFGEGLVRTPENFGRQGERPTHPRLLDWLAAELVASGWDIKHLHRVILLSATYRQRSDWTPELLEQDPHNRWLARGPRFRLSAETVRDRALAASGLLVDRLGGASVKPYQPDGLWKEIASDTDYQVASGPDLYRRSLYTYWKRTVSPPLMAALDAPTREACVVRRSRTNTPMQALGLLNETGYLEAARALAFHTLKRGGVGEADWIRYAVGRTLNREPLAQELERLSQSFRRHRDHYEGHEEERERLLSIGQSRFDDSVDETRWAALTLVCSTLMNLDEFVTLD